MRIALWGSGVLTALVLLVPQIVIVGFILFLLPGLILMAMPTVFAYLLATWAISRLLPIRRKWLARGAALGIALALASLAVLPLRMQAIAAFERAQLPDIKAEAAIALSGHVRIERPDFLQDGAIPPCDALCLAILDLDAVQSVTMAQGQNSAAYRLVTWEEEAALPAGMAIAEPYSPGQILRLMQTTGSASALDAYWEKRLSSDERLVRGGERPRPDWTLRNITVRRSNGWLRMMEPFVSRAEILSGTTVLLRTSASEIGVPLLPPFATLEAGGALSGGSDAYFTLAYSLRNPGGAVTGNGMSAGGQDAALARAIALKDYSEIASP